MGIENRPYVGSWRLGQKKVIQYTPDALVYINGDTAIPGCPKCNGKIDVQQYVTEVSVDAGTEPSAGSAHFTLSVPIHGNEAIIRDGQFLIRPGLEVHIYFRGYFPVKGMYSNLTDPRDLIGGSISPTGESFANGTVPPSNFQGRGPFTDKTPPNGGKNMTEADLNNWAREVGVSPDALMATIVLNSEMGNIGTAQNQPNRRNEREAVINSLFNRQAKSSGKSIFDVATGKERTTGSQGEQVPGTETLKSKRPFDSSRVPTGRGLTSTLGEVTGTLQKRAADGLDNGYGVVDFIATATQNAQYKKREVTQTSGGLEDIKRQEGYTNVTSQLGINANTMLTWAKGTPNPNYVRDLAIKALTPEGQVPVVQEETPVNEEPAPVTADVITDPNLSESLLPQNLKGFDVENVLAHPYYMVFHGVVINVGGNYSGGVQTISVQCASMLHFWQYHQVVANANVAGGGPSTGRGAISVVGHNFTGWHPYAIMYALYYSEHGAAAGVEWSVSQKTNTTAVSSETGEQMQSLLFKYWEKRFQSKAIRLRLHAATGELYSAAQAAFLGRMSTEDLTSLVRGTYGPKMKRAHNIASAMAFTMLFNEKQRQSLVVATKASESDPNSPKPSADVSMAEMQAFVLDLGKVGQPEIFTTSYESKLDIANKVCEVTGFEFYQDVDGDFVFKPPFYNLDTSSSRVYRIEDIDIININFDEKEPQVTYMIAKNEGVENITSTGMSNEYGPRGHYVDWRLVSQFGWRPGYMETTYFANRSALFYASMNRMTVLNAPINSATVTVPERPEIRPGYPMYITYLDCFYYLHSFSHSHSVGGQCTTSLQLIAKRAKFHAPGNLSKTGIEAIDLADPSLPQKPLVVQDEAGRPRMQGFPNVVMALDPEKVNPLSLLTGNSLSRIDDPTVLKNLVDVAVQLHVLRPKGDGSPIFLLDVNANQQIELMFQSKDNLEANPPQGGFAIPSGTKDLQEIAREYISRQNFSNTRMGNLESAVKGVQDQIIATNKQLQLLKTKPDTASQDQLKILRTKLQGLESQKAKALAEIDTTRADFENSLDGETKIGVQYLITLLKQMGEQFGLKDVRGWEKGRYSSTLGLLDLLSSKKSIMKDGIAGEFRYYSASHPQKEQQGQKIAVMRTEVSNDPRLSLDAPNLTDEYAGRTVRGFLPNAKVTTQPGGKKPDAKMGDIPVYWGIKVLSNSKDKKEDILPTDAIFDFKWSIQEVEQQKRATDTKVQSRMRYTDISLAIGLDAGNNVGSPDTSQSVADVMKHWFDKVLSRIQFAVTVGKSQLELRADRVPEFPAITAPLVIVVQGGYVATEKAIGPNYIFMDNPDGSVAPFLNSPTMSLELFWKKAAVSYGRAVADEISAELKIWIGQMEGNGLSNAEVGSVVDAFNEILTQAYGTLARPITKTKKRHETPVKHKTFTPVLPVSDASGYEVIGTYRYGRGLDIEPNGVFDVLHRQDPASLLDRDQVERIIDNLIKGEPKVAHTQIGVSKNGAPIFDNKQVSLTEAVTANEKEIIAQLRGVLTDKQLLDFKLALATGDPNMLAFGMANWLAEKGKDGIQKIPVNNAAYALADLNLNSGRHVCGCRMAESEVLLDAAQQMDFAQFGGSGSNIPRDFVPDNADDPTKWSIEQIALAAGPYQQSQEAIRGTMLDQKPSTLIQTVAGLEDEFKKVSDDLDTQKKNIRTSAGNIGPMFEVVKKDFER